MKIHDALKMLQAGHMVSLLGTDLVLYPEYGVSNDTLLHITIGDALSDQWQDNGLQLEESEQEEA